MYNLQLDRKELESLSTIVSNTITQIIDSLKSERAAWNNVEPLATYWWEILDLKLKLQNLKPVERLDLSEKLSMKDFYNCQ